MALEVAKSEDFIEYFIFPDINQHSDEALHELSLKISDIAKSFTSSYIWHKDSFEIRKRQFPSILSGSENNEHIPPHLYGISHFGDNIQDEWLIVSLLLHISKELPSIIIRTCDSDGEFLLIEAAEYLPSWANPDTCEQRVYIHNGYFHVVHEPSDNENEVLPVADAVRRVRSNPTKYIVSKDVEKSINERIKSFPASIGENLHRQTVFVPLGVAALLQHNPQLIAPAVQAFCNRDPIDMKACRAMRFFPPENRVYTSVVFTKCLYAMIMHSNYLPDRRTGWNLPPSSSQLFKAHLLGVKIACGFEILASQAKSSNVNFETDREWQKYLESLKDKNYFQDELEGSKKYQELLQQAKDYFKDNRESMRTSHKVGDDILRTLKQLDINANEFKKSEQTLPESDSDSWLNISPEDLDEMLQKRYGIKNLFSNYNNVNSGQLTEMLSGFLDKESEFDGVDLNENVPSLSEILKNSQASDTSMDLAGTSSSKSSKKVDFDPDAFCSTVQNLLDLVIPEDKWDSQSDMSDYENDDDLLAKNIDEISKNRFIKGRKKKGSESAKTNIDVYMDQMDRELANTTIGKSFEKKANAPASKATLDEDFDDIEDFQPVDIDMNVIKNMMESYQLQGASAGPTSNLLASLMSDSKSKKQTDV